MDSLPGCVLIELLRHVSASRTATFQYALVCRRWLEASPEAQAALFVRPGAQLHARTLLAHLSRFRRLDSLTLCPGSMYAGHLPSALLTQLAAGSPALTSLSILGSNTAWTPSSLDGLSRLLGGPARPETPADSARPPADSARPPADSARPAPRLKTLVLCGHGAALVQLPPSLGLPPSLKQLRLELDTLRSIPEASLSPLASLRALTLQSRFLETLPEALGCCSSLRVLSVCSPVLRLLPESLSSLTRLKKLSLQSPALFLLPESISSLTSLKKLSVTAKRLPALPDSLGCLTSLRLLRLASEALLALPDSLTSLRALRRLSVNGCVRLGSLPRAMHRLSCLEALSVEKCPNLRRFPEALYQLCSLRLVSAGDNLSGFLAGSHLVSFPSPLRHVCISFSTGQSLPGSLCSSLPGLQGLTIRNCPHLLHLPDDLGSLRSLRQLQIADCPVLQGLPDSATALESLQTLSVRRCRRFSCFPENLGGLTQLKNVELQGLDPLKAAPGAWATLSAQRGLQSAHTAL